MLSAQILREDPEKVKTALIRRNRNPNQVEEFLAMDKEWRELTLKLDEARAKQNKLTKERKIEEAKTLKEEVKKIVTHLPELEKKRGEALSGFPNIPADDVPVGRGE